MSRFIQIPVWLILTTSLPPLKIKLDQFTAGFDSGMTASIHPMEKGKRIKYIGSSWYFKWLYSSGLKPDTH